MISLRPGRLGAAATLAAALAVTTAACGSSSKTTSSATSATTATSSTTAPASTTTAPATGSSTTAGSSSTTAAGGAASGDVPAVTGGTDLAHEPMIAAGGNNPPTTLQVKDLVVGTGATPTASDTVKVQYVGALYSNGSVFDASWTDSGATSFPLNGVVPGFSQAIEGMKVGGRREVVIPPALGYGAAGRPPTIPANATLVFVIDLLGIVSS